MKKSILLLTCVFLLARFLPAQDLGAIGKGKALKVTGTLSANQILYGADGINNRRQPYNYFLSGNLNVSLYGWAIPLSYAYSNQQSQFQQPFNQFGATPYYKWVKLHVGYSSMSFSPYTLNGHIFLGGGVQLTPPGLFRFSAMYGRLNKAINEQMNISQSLNPDGNPVYDTAVTNTPYYERWGGGFKVGVGKGSNYIDGVFFMAKDDPNSIKAPLRSQVLPAENVVMSLLVSKSIFKRLVFSGEYATSAFTRDIRAEGSAINNSLFKHIPTFHTKSSTAFYDAFKANLNYVGDGYMIGAGYERIDPGYRTLGAYYFNDDLENITMNASTKFNGGRGTVGANVGLQHNDLKGDKMSRMNRYIYAGNINYAFSKRLNMNASYSNFQTFTRIKTQDQLQNAILDPKLNGNPDTLNFTQLSQSANLGATYALTNPSDKTVRNTLSTNLTYQVAGDQRNNQNIGAGTRFYNANLSYNRSLTPIALNITFGFNTNYNELEQNNSLLLSPTFMVSKGFFNKTLRPTFNLSYTKAYANKKELNNVFNARAGCSYTIKKKHNFNTNITVINRQVKQETQSKNARSFTEYTWTLGYSFSF